MAEGPLDRLGGDLGTLRLDDRLAGGQVSSALVLLELLHSFDDLGQHLRHLQDSED